MEPRQESPSPYSEGNFSASQPTRRDAGPPYKIRRKPIAPTRDNERETRGQMPNTESHSTRDDHIPKPQHQRSFQDIRTTIGREHSPPIHDPASQQVFGPPSALNHSPQAKEDSHHNVIVAERPHQPVNQQYESQVTTNLPTLHHHRSFQETSRPQLSEGTAADSGHLPQRPNLSLATSVPLRLTESQLYTSPQTASTVTPDSLSLSSASAVNSLPSTAATSYSEASPPSASATSKPNAVQNALREVRHFAGGLVSHPYETTKHYTILRHSHGLVFYQGTSTSLAISIFSDTVLPPDRSLWLQSKGYSGKTGMRMKAFVGATGSWLNVTPSMQISAEQLNPSDERAWQRDIAKFRKKAKPEKIREKHQLRETVVLRIPAEAGDGYFAVVLCTGDKKKLCSSPSFRLLSTSTGMHSIRGASLSTLPLELGAMAVNIYATNTIRTIAGPVTSSIQNQVSQFIPSSTQKALEKASSTAYDVSGGKKRVDAYVQSSNDQYEQRLQDSYAPSNYSDVPLDQGPQPPYPIRFTCTSEPVPPIESSSLPTTTLTGVPDYITHQLHGHYFAWVRSIPQKSQDVEAEDWQQALLSALPPSSTQIARANFVAANKRTLTVHLVDPYSSPLPQSRISVLVLGFLRPPTQLPPSTQAASDEAILLEEANDIAFAQGVLDHPAFSPEAIEQGKEKPGMKKKYADMRTQIDRVPLHKLGVRTDSDKMKERGIVVGGFYILR